MKLKTILAAALVIALLAAAVPVEHADAVGMSYTPSSYYQTSVFYRRLESLQLTGDQRVDIVNVAFSQVGYHEGDSLGELTGSNMGGSCNYSEFAYWFGTQVMGQGEGFYHAWCAMFISWCARQAGVPVGTVSNAAYARPDGPQYSGGYGYFHVAYYSPGEYSPKCGDIIFIDWEADGTWDHAGLVCFFDGSSVGTIEGNAEDGVKHRVYDISDPVIRAFGVPNYTSAAGDNASAFNKARSDSRAALLSAFEKALQFRSILLGPDD